jgi:hypothetical protein
MRFWRRKKDKIQTMPINKAVESTSHLASAEQLTKEFLKEEYSALVSLYVHAENTLYALFNFYLTLLSAITGATVVLIQLNATQVTATYPGLAIFLGFVVLLGIITQDAIIRKNVDMAHYARAMNALKAHMLQAAPEIQQRIFYQHNLLTQVSPIPPGPDALTRWHQRLWWMTPLGMHQLFVGLVNSLSLVIVTIVLIPGAFSLSIPLWRLLVVGPVTAMLFYIAHCTYAKKKFQRGLRKTQITMAGQTHQW